MTLPERLELLAFDLILLRWPKDEIVLLYEAAYRLRQIERQGGAVRAF
jgi:hypothetical protein